MTQITQQKNKKQKKKERRAQSISKPGILITTNSLPKIENKINLRNHITEQG